MLEDLLANPLSTRVGWTLVHSLWQGMLLCLLLGAALLTLDPVKRNELRHSISSCLLVLWLLAPIITAEVASLASRGLVLEDGRVAAG